MQPTRTRRFPIKLSIKKRIFWSICGPPGLCKNIFAELGSRPELVDFLLNCLLRNAFFGRSAVIRTFAISFLQFWATRRFPTTLFIEKRICLVDLRSFGFYAAKWSSLISYNNMCVKKRFFFVRSAVIRTFALQFWAADSNSSSSYQTVN